MSSKTKAVILAGGKGTRLAPYTTVFPKPMVPLGRRPILEILICQLAFYGIRDIILSTGYLGELIQAYFQNGNGRFKHLNLTYIKEHDPLGTAGSLSLIPKPDQTFLVMNGDILTSMDYSKLLSYHREKGGILTIGMYRKQIKIDLGVIETDSEKRLIGYTEKPEKTYDVSMGIYVYEPAVLNYIEPATYLDFPDLVLRLTQNGEKVVGYPFNDFWLDIGRCEDYALAQKKFERLQDRLLPAGEL
jgi:NDP-sugar pyrophosphorylase family protein